MIKLKDELVTAYLTVDFRADFDSLCAQSKGKMIDLADCKFTPQVANLLPRYYSSVRFINSKDRGLNELLEKNTSISVRGDANSEKLKYVGMKMKDIVGYIGELSETTVYDIDYDSSNATLTNYMQAMAILITIARPSIRLNLKDHAMDIFRRCKLDWIAAGSKNSFYWEAISTSSVVRRECVNGMVKTPYGLVKERIYTTSPDWICMPGCFGTEQCTHKSEFKDLIGSTIASLKEVVDNRRSLLDYLEVRD